MPDNQSAVPVSQRAREAAADTYVADHPKREETALTHTIRAGSHDRNSRVQAFAAFERDILAGQSVGDERLAAIANILSGDDVAGGITRPIDGDRWVVCKFSHYERDLRISREKGRKDATPASDSPAIPEEKPLCSYPRCAAGHPLACKCRSGNEPAPASDSPAIPEACRVGDRVRHRDGREGTIVEFHMPGWVDWRPDDYGKPGAMRTDPSNLTVIAVKPIPASHTAPIFIEFAPSFKTINPKPSNQGAATGTFWYAEGWIGGERFEFSAQESRSDAERLCVCLNTALTAVLATPAPSRDEVERPVWQDALDAQEAECRRLREALMPFATVLEKAEGDFTKADQMIGGPITDDDMATVKIGDLRRARRALSNKDTGDVQ